MFATYRFRDHQTPLRLTPSRLSGCAALALVLTCLASCNANRFDAADNAATPADSNASQDDVEDAAARDVSTHFVPNPETSGGTTGRTTELSGTSASSGGLTGVGSEATELSATESSTDAVATSGTPTTEPSGGGLSNGSSTELPDPMPSTTVGSNTPNITGASDTIESGSVGSDAVTSPSDDATPTAVWTGTRETRSEHESSTTGVTLSMTLDGSSVSDAGVDAAAASSDATGADSDVDASVTNSGETISETSSTPGVSTDGASSSTESDSTSAPLVCTVTRTLPGVVRDFAEAHPDMEPCDDDGIDCRSEKGLVQSVLGTDGKPHLAEPLSDGAPIHGADTFNQWFNDVEGVNTSVPFDLQMTVQRNRPMVKTFDSANPPNGSPAGFSKDPKGFFPIDELNTTTRPHNYSFTYEVVTYVEYAGGETLTVKGDDDIFVFLNRQLVIDLGGIHLPEEATIDFDDLASEIGLERGKVYDLRLFFAERHVEQSNLFLSTTARFMNCTTAAGN